MAEVVSVRGVRIGEGKPKIIVPIVEVSGEEICKKAAEFSHLEIDVIEWRADFYKDIFDLEKTQTLIKALREAAADKALLFTFRTKKEGGQRDIGPDYYTRLNTLAAKSGCADLVDVEIFSGDAIVSANIANIHAANALVIASSHDFDKTPPKAELVGRFQKMQDMGADILKIAVMPQDAGDVLTLLSATWEMSQSASKPIVSMAMGAQGTVTRMVGEVFGSAATFGAIGKSSAPGQIPVETLAQVLDILNEALDEKRDA